MLPYLDQIFAIDFGQAVDLSSRTNRHLKFEEAKPLLRRDLENAASYFSEYDVKIDVTAEYERLTTRFEKVHLYS
jgi:serine/threonine-protein kinase RIO1